MGQIKVDPDRLEEFADKIGDAKSSCGDALSALKWHFSSLIAEVSDIEGGYASELYQQLVNHIEHYQNLLDQSQAVVKRTAAEFRQADESWFGHLLDVGAEILPIHDFQRLFGEYDPVTGEKLGFGDRLLAFGMIASSIFPPARGAGLLVKTGIKGVKMIKMSEEGAKLVKGVKNVLNPDLIKNAFRNSYQAVKNQSLSLTNKIVKKAGDIRLPQVLQPEFAGIGKMETTVGDVVKSAKDTMMKAVGREGGGSTSIDFKAKSINKSKNLYRGDSLLHSSKRPNGIGKPYISSSGNLVPASKDGLYKGRQVTVTEHILGGYRKGAKSNSPYISFTNNKFVVKSYGDNSIELNIAALRKAIRSGDVKDIVVLSPKQVQKLIERDRMTSDFWKKRAYNWTKRDREYLIKGEIPSRFIKILPKKE